MGQEEIKNIIKQAIEEYEEKKQEEAKDEIYHNTYLLMKNYNVLKAHAYDLKGEIDDIEEELHIEKADEWLVTISKSKVKTLKMLAYIKNAMELTKKRFEKKNENYKYLAFKLKYVDENNNEVIMKKLRCSKNRPNIWIEEVMNEMATILWGIGALK